MLRLKVLLLSLLLLLGGTAAASEPLRPFKAKYTVHLNGFKVGELKRRLFQMPDGNYVLSNEMYTTGLASVFKGDHVTERSIWSMEEGVMRPLLYTSTYEGQEDGVQERVKFDWAAGIAYSLRNGKTTELPLGEETIYDKLGYQIAMRLDLQRGAGEHLIYPVIDRSKFDDYEFDVVGEEDVVTTFGTVRTVKVVKGTTTVWLAPDYDYLMVKIHQEEEDYSATSYITDLRGLGE